MPKRDDEQTSIDPMSGPERRQAERVATRPAGAEPFAPVDGELDRAGQAEGDGE